MLTISIRPQDAEHCPHSFKRLLESISCFVLHTGRYFIVDAQVIAELELGIASGNI